MAFQAVYIRNRWSCC